MDEVMQKPQKNRRVPKWVWLIVAGSILFMLLIVGAVFGILFFVRSIMINNDAYRTAVAYIENSAEVREAVGEITGYGFFPTGGISTGGHRGGEANFTITVRGTRGNARVAIALLRPPGELDWIVVRRTIRAG